MTIILQELARGNIVDLGDFGSFSLRIRGEGADTAEEVSAHNITRTVAAFRPGKQFRQFLDDIEYEKL